MTSTVLHTLGYVVVDEAFKHSIPQEFAGASQIVEVPAGRYPVQVKRSAPQYSRPATYAGVQLEGVLTYDAWFGTNTRVSEPNTPAKPFDQMYLYQLANGFAGKSPRKGWRFELAEGYSLNDDGQIMHAGERIRVDGV